MEKSKKKTTHMPHFVITVVKQRITFVWNLISTESRKGSIQIIRDTFLAYFKLPSPMCHLVTQTRPPGPPSHPVCRDKLFLTPKRPKIGLKCLQKVWKKSFFCQKMWRDIFVNTPLPRVSFGDTPPPKKCWMAQNHKLCIILSSFLLGI